MMRFLIPHCFWIDFRTTWTSASLTSSVTPRGFANAAEQTNRIAMRRTGFTRRHNEGVLVGHSERLETDGAHNVETRSACPRGEAARTERWRPRRLDWLRLAASAASSQHSPD